MTTVNKNSSEILYLINNKYPVEYAELTNIYTPEEDTSIYVRKFTITEKIRENIILICHNDSRKYSWNSNSKLLLRKKCNLFAYEYNLITDNDVGEYLYHQSIFKETLQKIQEIIIYSSVNNKLIDEEDFKIIDKFESLKAILVEEQKILKTLQNEDLKNKLILI